MERGAEHATTIYHFWMRRAKLGWMNVNDIYLKVGKFLFFSSHSLLLALHMLINIRQNHLIWGVNVWWGLLVCCVTRKLWSQKRKLNTLTRNELPSSRKQLKPLHNGYWHVLRMWREKILWYMIVSSQSFFIAHIHIRPTNKNLIHSDSCQKYIFQSILDHFSFACCCCFYFFLLIFRIFLPSF